jgi:hypothetical protein
MRIAFFCLAVVSGFCGSELGFCGGLQSKDAPLVKRSSRNSDREAIRQSSTVSFPGSQGAPLPVYNSPSDVPLGYGKLPYAQSASGWQSADGPHLATGPRLPYLDRPDYLRARLCQLGDE